jgi:hypothetical protein
MIDGRKLPPIQLIQAPVLLRETHEVQHNLQNIPLDHQMFSTLSRIESTGTEYNRFISAYKKTNNKVRKRTFSSSGGGAVWPSWPAS